ncbi:hypothetical protein MRS44_001822 [Fusarium solani]|uniref:uncharacterized protein n=1 Tax=Fusarium solani TaxID=169388 RepID=UPI0032C48D54|nr:hypothetical protein MRS44_001822 [Fusarium solani]
MGWDGMHARTGWLEEVEPLKGQDYGEYKYKLSDWIINLLSFPPILSPQATPKGRTPSLRPPFCAGQPTDDLFLRCSLRPSTPLTGHTVRSLSRAVCRGPRFWRRGEGDGGLEIVGGAKDIPGLEAQLAVLIPELGGAV